MSFGIQPSTLVRADRRCPSWITGVLQAHTRTVIPRCARRQEVTEHPPPVNMTSQEQGASVVDELRRREVVDAEKGDTIWTGSSTIT